MKPPETFLSLLKRDGMCYVVLLVVILHLLGVLPGALEKISPAAAGSIKTFVHGDDGGVSP